MPRTVNARFWARKRTSAVPGANVRYRRNGDIRSKNRDLASVQIRSRIVGWATLNPLSIAGAKQQQRCATSLMPILLALALQGCVSHVTIGFDQFPDGSQVSSWNGSDSKPSGISTQYADPTSWGYRRGLELKPPDGAAFIPRSSPDASSPPNELCLVRFEGSEGEPGLASFPEPGVYKVWITITSGEATITSINRRGREIESRDVGPGRHEFGLSKGRGGIVSLSILDAAGAKDPFCFDDVEWGTLNLFLPTGSFLL